MTAALVSRKFIPDLSCSGQACLGTNVFSPYEESSITFSQITIGFTVYGDFVSIELLSVFASPHPHFLIVRRSWKLCDYEFVVPCFFARLCLTIAYSRWTIHIPAKLLESPIFRSNGCYRISASVFQSKADTWAAFDVNRQPRPDRCTRGSHLVSLGHQMFPPADGRAVL